MHIQEGTNTTLTTCTKMTEEVDRRHGVNGNSSSKAVSEDAPQHNSALNATGGRLKFFKDGKFILELVRGVARGGGSGGWVSVPRKTFWPPAGAPGTPPGAGSAPPSAALSLSDDNSSVHSSPWQRDHCWKQPAPRKNLSKHLALYYCRPSTLPSAAIDAVSRVARRRPFDAGLRLRDPPAPDARPNGVRNGACDAALSPRGDDAVDGAARPRSDDEHDREIYHRMKLKKPHQHLRLRVYRKTRTPRRRRPLAHTVARLLERAPPAPAPAPVNAKLAHCRQEHAIVSPRKRILRELERVSLEEHGTKRRAKTAPALSTASYPPPPSPGPSHAPPPPAPAPRPPPAAAAAAPKHVSSYSIHSLLSMPDEAAPRRSPDARRDPTYAHSIKTESLSSGMGSPAPSPSPDAYRYVSRHAASGPPAAQGARDAGTPPAYRAQYAAPTPTLQYATRAWPPTYRSGGSQAPAPVTSPRDEWARDVPYVYGYGYMPHVYRTPAPLWMHYAVPPAPSPWAPMALPLLTDHIPKDEPTSDLPLNLSKH